MKDTNEKQKKGFMAAIWESMTKTGGCCGSGENCCGPSQPNDGKEKAKEKNDRPPTAGAAR
jgi:hypothetical protein